MKVASLHYSNTIINLEKTFGMQVMELGDLRELGKRGVDARLFAKDIIGDHPKITKIKYNPHERDLYDLPYYTRFFDKNQDADVLQGNCTPLLAAFAPNKTVIRLDGAVDFPLAGQKNIQKVYNDTHYIFVSEYLKNYYQEKYPFISNDKSYVLYNAVDDHGSKVVVNKRKKLFFCSRWVSYKGVYVLLDALERVARTRDDYDVIIVGGIQTANINDGMNKDEEDIKDRLNKIKNVKVLGFIPHGKLLDLLKSVDLVLFPSLYEEPFGLIPAEAAMAGVPTIAFDVGGVPEVVKHNHTGIILDKSRFKFLNAKKLTDTIVRMLDNEKLMVQLGENARERCLKKFGWETYIDNLLDIYEKIASAVIK